MTSPNWPLRMWAQERRQLTAEQAVKVFSYDPETGLLLRVRPIEGQSTIRKPIAGYIDRDGYRTIKVLGYTYFAHRVIWLMQTGSWPDGFIDHINGVRHDNRFCNLRVVDRAMNQQNMHAARADSSSGVLGVSLHKKTGKWRAQLSINGRTTYLGVFDSMEEARLVYLQAKRKHHPGATI